MNCRTARKKTALLVGDDLSQPEAAELLVHLRCCSDCASHHQELLTSTDVLVTCNDNPVRRDRDSIWPDVQANVRLMEAAASPRQRFTSANVMLAAVTACVVLVAMSPGLFRFSGPSTGAMTIPVSTGGELYDETVSAPTLLLQGEYVPLYSDQSWRVLEPMQRRNAEARFRSLVPSARKVSGY